MEGYFFTLMISIKYTPTWVKVLVAISVVALPAMFMTLQVVNSQHVSCYVCIHYKGSTECRNAQANNKKDCQQTATDNACALMTAGMTETIQCSNTEPSEITFK